MTTPKRSGSRSPRIPDGLLASLVLTSLVHFLIAAAATAATLPAGFQETIVFSGLTNPAAVRFLPDYLRQVNQFQTIALLEPKNAFHPNLAPPAICLHLYPGMPLVEMVEALHALFSWRLRQLAENDALNRDACAWGRAHLDELPLDNRPLFGKAVTFQLEEIT